jgi:hypothetical protein
MHITAPSIFSRKYFTAHYNVLFNLRICSSVSVASYWSFGLRLFRNFLFFLYRLCLVFDNLSALRLFSADRKFKSFVIVLIVGISQLIRRFLSHCGFGRMDLTFDKWLRLTAFMTVFEPSVVGFISHHRVKLLVSYHSFRLRRMMVLIPLYWCFKQHAWLLSFFVWRK